MNILKPMVRGRGFDSTRPIWLLVLPDLRFELRINKMMRIKIVKNHKNHMFLQIKKAKILREKNLIRNNFKSQTKWRFIIKRS